MKTNRLVPFLALSLLISGCEKENNILKHEPKPINLPTKAPLVIARSNSFGISLFNEVAKNESGNLMISPLSANVALTMLLNGCAGSTYTQIHDMLGYGTLTLGEINESYQQLVSQLLTVDPEVTLALANAIWYRESFAVKPPFLDTMSNRYSAHVEALDFSLPAALNKINGWASDNTHGKIPKVLDEISPDAVMFLMNALYFKGTWTYRFDESKTSSQPFHLEGGSSVNVDMMCSTISGKMSFGSGYSALEMPYGQSNFSMVVVLPTGSLSDFYTSFTYSTWGKIIADLDSTSSEAMLSVDVTMPKFKFSWETLLNNQLKALGMVDAFDPDIANLTGISNQSIYVNFVKQNSFIEVNEEGTEAAAVTTVGVFATSAGGSGSPYVFRVDKPFIFAIRERTTNTLLFIGKIVDPS
jgi:serpin B